MRVLEATIELMYRQPVENKGDGYRPKVLYDVMGFFEPQPDPANPFFQAERPADVTFPRNQTGCNSAMHYPNDMEGGCPCNLLNVELAGVFAFVCESLGARDGADIYCSWKDPRWRHNWSALIRNFMDGDRMQPLIEDCKDACRRGGSVENFYQSLGSGMETDTDKMAYNIGDVIGIVRMFKVLTSGGDPDVLAMRLYGQNCIGRHEELDRVTDYHQEIQRRIVGLGQDQMAHPDVLQEVAAERRRDLMTKPCTVPTTSEPRGEVAAGCQP